MFETLIQNFVQMKEKEVLDLTRTMLLQGTDPQEILNASQEALESIGRRFESGQSFLPELIMGGEIMKQVSEVIKPEIEIETRVNGRGKVLVGTVAGDIHDIGKDLVVFMLEVNGFEVCDLGVDVAPQQFVDKIREFEPRMVALSALLTTAFDSMKTTIRAIQDAGLRDQVKIAIGGGTIDELLVGYTGADAYGADAVAAVNLAKKWVEEV